MNTNPSTEAYPWPTITVDIDVLKALVKDCKAHGVKYGLGAKAPSLKSEPSEIKKLDCSGFIRWAIAKASKQRVIFTDGSVQQHEQCEKVGFKRSTIASAMLHDGKLRVGFLSPKDGGGIGHVLLARNGMSY